MDLCNSLHPVPSAWLGESDLATFVPAYVQRLVSRRYAVATVRVYVHCVAHFAHWTHHCRLFAEDITDDVVQCFLDKHLPICKCSTPVQRSRHQVRAALRQLLSTLVDQGVLSNDTSHDRVETQLAQFNIYMKDARGLAESTRTRRLSVIRSLLRMRLAVDANTNEMAVPSADELRQFISRELKRISPASASSLAGALRGYLRFLAISGARVEHLLPIIASPACWRLASLPQTLSQSEIEQLLEAFPPEIPSHRRGYAMVRCLVDLGLRECEVTNLELDDIDWQAGTLRINKGKAHGMRRTWLKGASCKV